MTARKMEAQRLQKDWNENPRWKGIKRGEGQRDLVVSVCGAIVRPGDWIYADRDGVLVSARPLHS